MATALNVLTIGALLPFSPLANALGFKLLPAAYFAFLAIATVTYLLLVEVGVRILLCKEARSRLARHRDAMAMAT